ncbi:MAG: CHAT domain-containing protein [Actinomycetota bacterium]|nr:CHAT domain-containing protein [Actinomycetota bacterium]
MDPWEYLDFELEIGEGAGRTYPVSVRSPKGEARAQMRFPFDEWELKDRLQALEIALLRSGGKRRRIPSPQEQAAQDFGRGLFDALLVGDVRTRFEMSLDEARRQNKGLRLKLRIRPPELAHLPWEFLYDAEQDRYLCLSATTPLVRHLDLPRGVERLAVSPPLRVLGMVTSPSGLEALDVEHEKRLVEEAVKRLRAQNLLELTWLDGQTWRYLQRAMRGGPWHVFHFVGHGGFDPATEEGALAFADEAGRKRLLRAASLAELLDDHYPLRLVFLNSCEGARGSDSDAFSSTAATLVRRGVPAVVAMQYEITDEAAIEFSRDFYEALADGLPVDTAVTEARTAVSMESTLEWGTPVLYMRSPDGRIFDMPTEGRSSRSAETNEQTQPREEQGFRRSPESVGSTKTDESSNGQEAERFTPARTPLPNDTSRGAREQEEQPRGARRWIVLTMSFVVLALVGLASLILIMSVPDNNGKSASNDQSAGQPRNPGNVLFRDNFSNASSGWNQAKEDNVGNYYDNGRYRIYAVGTTRFAISPIELPEQDVVVQVDASRTGDAPSSPSSNWGIICRSINNENFYQMGIGYDGHPYIRKLKNNGFSTLASGPSYQGSAIREGRSSNHIRGDCLGSKLTLYVNDQKVLEARDAEFGSGNVGLYVQDTGNGPPGTDVSFDNFSISEP